MKGINLEHIVWKSEYNIGNFKIDNEHQHLFLIAQKAMNMMDKEKVEISEIKEIIKSLFEYVSTHFKNEEEHMRLVNYPDLQRHKELHKKMITMLTSLIEEINTLKQDEIKKRIYDFINEYFVKHIISEDKKIQLYELPLEELRESFGWKEIYTINNQTIDNEHKKLFDIASSAFEVVEDEKRNEKIRTIVKELYEYMKTHFSHEENYMESINYEYLESHKLLHQTIINTLNEFVKQLPSMDTETFEKELARIIDISLVQHIIQEDRKIISWEKMHK